MLGEQSPKFHQKIMSDRNAVRFTILFYVAIFLFAVHFLGGNSKGYNPSKVRKVDLDEEFMGVVTKKYCSRGCRVFIQKLDGVFEICNTTDCLYDSAQVGDTIIKKKGTNLCTILKGRKIECDCYYAE